MVEPVMAPSPNHAAPAVLERLRARIRRLEGSAPAAEDDGAAAALGAPEIDGALPWGGLKRAVLHAVTGDGGVVAGFCAGLAARLAGARGAVLWCRREGDLYGPGLHAFGLTPARLILARVRRPADLLWAMEEGLRSGAPAAVLGEATDVPPVAARRLQLAAEAGGGTGLLLLPGNRNEPPLPAMTRWRVRPVPGEESVAGVGRPRWRVDLLHCRGGRPAAWIVEWRDDETGGFAVAADLRHGPDETAARPATIPERGAVVGFRRAG